MAHGALARAGPRVSVRRRRGARVPRSQGTLRRPANDDRESIGQILRTLQRRPARTSYIVATVFAVVWVFAGLMLGWMYLPQLAGRARPDRTDRAGAGRARRDLSSRRSSSSTCSPTWHGGRRNCGSSPSPWPRSPCGSPSRRPWRANRSSPSARRSAARSPPWATASSARWRAPPSSRRWWRTRSRRSSTPTTTTKCASARCCRISAASATRWSARPSRSATPSTASISISSHDISQISELVAEQVNEASRRITHTLAEKGEHITRALGHAGDTMIQTLGERGGDLLDRLESTSQETSQAIAAASDRLTSTLNFKTDHIGDEFTEITANLQHMMSVRLDRVTEGFAQKSAAILDMMSNRSQEMTELVIDTGNRARRHDLQPRRGSQHHAQEHRQFAGARPEPARRRRRLQAGADRHAHHRHHRPAQQPGDRPVPRERGSRSPT